MAAFVDGKGVGREMDDGVKVINCNRAVCGMEIASHPLFLDVTAFHNE